MNSSELRSANKHYIAEFAEGDKRLVLMIDIQNRFANTLLSRVENRVKEEGATTIVYERARDYVQQVVEDTQQAITYRFSTKFATLQAWAMDENKGKMVFAWDTTFHKGSSLIGLKVFKPGNIA